MCLLSRLFHKEEPQQAPELARAPEDRPEYVPRGKMEYRQELTCVNCGRSEKVEPYGRPKDGWKHFYGRGLPANGAEACPSCREAVEKWLIRPARDAAVRERLQNERRKPAYEAMRKWDSANPPPSEGLRNSSYTFVRRTTCGSCGMQTETEGQQHQLPSWPPDWQRVLPNRGPVVCPACYEKHAPLREAHAAWAAERDKNVGSLFRAADEGLPPVPKLRPFGRWKPW